MKNQKGFTIVETLLGITIFIIISVGFITGILFTLEVNTGSGDRSRAQLLAQECMEAARNIRNDDFSNLSSGTHGILINNNQWELNGSSDTIDKFTRELIVSDTDEYTKEAKCRVTWQQTESRQGEVSLSSLFTNWTLVVSASIGNWALPEEEITININGGNDGLKVDSQGDYAYFVRKGGNPEFVVVDISDPAAAFQRGSISLGGQPRNIYVEDDYAYVVSKNNSQEIQVIDIRNPDSPIQVETHNFNNKGDGYGIYGKSNRLYVVRQSRSSQDEFYIMDMTTPTSLYELGSLDLGSHGYEVVVLGDYAYIASNHNSRELIIVDISNPNSLSIDATYNLNGNQDAHTITGFDNTVILGRSDGKIYIFDITNPESPSLTGTYEYSEPQSGEDELCIKDITLKNDTPESDWGDYTSFYHNIGTRENRLLLVISKI
jgi:Tfp pilus assembly protein PilV